MNDTPWDDWDHVTKIDPDKELADGESFDDVVESGTDAIEVGGTLDVTSGKMRTVLEACRAHDIPVYQEPSNPSVVVDDDALDGYLVPIVLNAGEVSWITGAHKEWVKIDEVDWSRTTPEAYIVLNPEASVAELTDADCDQTPEDVAAYAEMAEHLLGQDIVYLEYSGTYGDPETVAAAADALTEATLFYGGGITGYDAAYEMGGYADTVVVGDLLHEEGAEALRATVEGVRDAHAESEAGTEAGTGVEAEH